MQIYGILASALRPRSIFFIHVYGKAINTHHPKDSFTRVCILVVLCKKLLSAAMAADWVKGEDMGFPT